MKAAQFAATMADAIPELTRQRAKVSELAVKLAEARRRAGALEMTAERGALTIGGGSLMPIDNAFCEGYWVEARTAIKSGRVMSYGVWHINTEKHLREKVGDFRTSRGWQVALHLANKLRDDLNAGIA